MGNMGKKWVQIEKLPYSYGNVDFLALFQISGFQGLAKERSPKFTSNIKQFLAT